MTTPTQLIVALDLPDREAALAMVRQLDAQVEWFKVGKQMFTRYGPDFVTAVKDQGKRVFLDLKYHDIPNTVARAVEAALALGVDMLNVHASGGPEMLAAAAAAASSANPEAILLAVTVLTSMDEAALRAVGVPDSPANQVARLAKLAETSGIAGVVCSAKEIELLRRDCARGFQLVVPGIRPAGSARGDQKRVMTPAAAASAGADYIVVGRPILQAPDPAAAAAAIVEELATAITKEVNE